MQAVAHGYLKLPHLSKEKATEYVGYNVGDKKYSKLKEIVKKRGPKSSNN